MIANIKNTPKNDHIFSLDSCKNFIGKAFEEK